MNAHALDYDDGTNSGIIHLGSPVFSLLLPLAERFDVPLDIMLRSAVIGYEVSYTLAISIQPTHKQLGFHATGTCGVLGATVAAACMLDYSEEEMERAFAAAGVAAAGMLKVLDEGSELKPYNVAKSSLLALTAVQIAKAGFKGSSDVLGGERGFFKMMTQNADIKLKEMISGSTYAIQKTYTKPYASCRYTHPAIEAAIWISEKNGIKPADISEIVVKTYSLAVRGHDHTTIPGAYSAKMSIPYSVASGIIRGIAGHKEFTEEMVRDEAMQELTKKVRVLSDDHMSEIFPDKQMASVEIKLSDERSFSKTVEFPKGEPENPLTDDEFKNRYEELMDYAGVDPAVSEKIYTKVFSGSEISCKEVTALF